MVMDDDREGVSLPSGPDAKKRRVSYFYEPSIGEYNYGQEHPMKPHRIRVAHNLIVQYQLHRRMEINRPFPEGPADIRQFHSQEYVDFLASVTPVTLTDPDFSRHRKRFNVCDDCPVFDGLFGFCQASAGGSIGAAVKLNLADADIALNWAGGLHHAKKAEASGFCYVNDIVLGILELLKVHRRVLYVDIDVHHGDGVEEAFYATDRVMTVSFHKFGDFFPGTGQIKDTGSGIGKSYALNVPLNDGMDDKSFRCLFRPIIQKVMEVYEPEAVVLQCGADSLSGDRLGCFNLSVKGHADCLHFLRSFNVRLMVLGGGGYTVPNVARCWCYETAVAVGVEPDNKLPYNEYYEYFGPDYTLHVEPCNMKNLNSLKDMEKIRNTLLEQLSRLPHVPSVPFQTTPPITQVPEEAEESTDQRPKPRIWNGEEYDSYPDEDEKPQHTDPNLFSNLFSFLDKPDLDQPSTQPHFKTAKPLWKVEGGSHEVKFLESLEVKVPSVSRNLRLSDELRSKMSEPTARPPGLHPLTAQALRAGTPQTSGTQVLGSAGINHPQTRISCPSDTQVPVTEVSDVPSVGASQPLGAVGLQEVSDHSEGEHLGSRPAVSDHSEGEDLGSRPKTTTADWWAPLLGDPVAALKELIPEDYIEKYIEKLAQLGSHPSTTTMDRWAPLLGDPVAALKELIPEDYIERLAQLGSHPSTTAMDRCAPFPGVPVAVLMGLIPEGYTGGRGQISAESLLEEFLHSQIESSLNLMAVASEYEKSKKSTRSELENALKDKEVELVVARKEVEFERARASRLEAMHAELLDNVCAIRARVRGEINAVRANLGSVEEEFSTCKAELVEARGKLKDAWAELFECQVNREFVEVQLVSTLEDLEKEQAKSQDLRHRLKASLSTLLDTLL